MLQLSGKGLRLLIFVFSLSIILGGLAILGLGIHLVLNAVQGEYTLPLVFSEGLQLAVAVKASSVGSYVMYSLLLEVCLILGLLALALLRTMLVGLHKEKALPKNLPASVRRMGMLLLVLAYARQLLFLLAFGQDLGALSGLVSYQFQLLPSQALYALLLLVLSEVFAYGLGLQHEYEQTV